MVLVAAALAAYYSVRATAWAVMTDELQVARLATSIADDLSPVPAIHGVYYGALSQLYPLLLAPFYGTLNAPAAQTAAHGLNAFLLAGAAWPAYLLARSVAESRGAGYVAAALVAFTPWLALASTLLTENVAYPAFVWALLLCHRAVSTPSPGRDAAALAGLLLAFLARTQLFVLALALPVVLVLHDTGFAVACREGTRRAAMSSGLSRIVARHRMLAAAYGVAAVGAGALALAGSLDSVVGNYATPFGGNLLPSGVWHSAATHLGHVAVGVGVLPLALAASWTVTTLVRPVRKESHAFAALAVVLVPLLTFQVASFDLRFTPGQFVQDRYLVYLVPLLAVASAAWLAQRAHRTLRLVTFAAAGAAVAVLVAVATYDDPVIFWAAPAAAFHPALEALAASFGLPLRALLPLATLVSVLVLAGVTRVAPTSAMVGSALALAGFGAFEAGYVLHRFGGPVMTRPTNTEIRDWIDAAVPSGRSAALVPSPRDAASLWWEAELWNKDVKQVLRVGSGTTFTPFPAEKVAIDFSSGVLRGSQPSDYLVVSPNDTRFQLRGTQLAKGGPLRLAHVRSPYRLSWATRGLTADGWTLSRRLATLRLYGDARAQRRALVMTLAAPLSEPKPVDFVLRSGAAVVRGSVDPGGARPPVRLTACVPARGEVDVTLVTSGRSIIEDGRLVGLHLDRLRVRDAGPCRASS